MMRKLFLDDERMPGDVTWIELHNGPYDVVRTQAEFEAYIRQHGIPDIISFDNDLGIGCGEGRKCARWMCDAIMDGEISFNPKMKFTVHSRNTVAGPWIKQYLDAFWKNWTEQSSPPTRNPKSDENGSTDI